MKYLSRRKALKISAGAIGCAWIARYANAAEFVLKVGSDTPASYPLNIRAQEAIYRRAFVNLPFTNGDDSWELPIPATFIIDCDGTILFASANEDYTDRPEPSDIIRVEQESR